MPAVRGEPPVHDVVYRASNVTLGYGSHAVLRGVNLEVRSGQFWSFLGPNGSGKTTLLRGFLGELKAWVGTLDLPPAIDGVTPIGFVPQRCEINPTLPITLGEFVGLGLVGTRLNKAQQREHLTWVLEALWLPTLARQSYWTLSGGQRQRALIARALVRRPRVLVMDEPTSNLDLIAENVVLKALTDFRSRHQAACLFVTHDLNLAERYATHVGLVAQGGVLAGERADILTRANLEQLYDRPAWGAAGNTSDEPPSASDSGESP